MPLGWVETRILACEQAIEWIKRWIQDWTPIIKAAQQAARTASSTYGEGGGGGAGAPFYCQPSAAVSGATGTWPAITATSFVADVYTTTGNALTLSTAGATCYNFNAAGLVAGKTVDLVPDGAGNFNAYTQSCT